MKEPAYSSRSYDEFISRFRLSMLIQEVPDLHIENGDLAMTKDLDLQLGDKAYSALYRLSEHWRHEEPHITHLYRLAVRMAERESEVANRVEAAHQADYRRRENPFKMSPEFKATWDAHWDEEGAAVSGRFAYSGCIVMLASNSLLRFKDDLDCPSETWAASGFQYGGHSIGEVIVASANGFRHGDEWSKTRTPTKQQRRSMDVLKAALDTSHLTSGDYTQPGQCEEVLEMLSASGGIDGFTATVMAFAHEITINIRSISN